MRCEALSLHVDIGFGFPCTQGIIAQIVPARPALLKRQDGQPFPPTLLVHMAERDPEWAAQIEETLRYCR